ncbi:MAG TPA: PspC domain-containing protein [Mycobacteriales bacterium]
MSGDDDSPHPRAPDHRVAEPHPRTDTTEDTEDTGHTGTAENTEGTDGTERAEEIEHVEGTERAVEAAGSTEDTGTTAGGNNSGATGGQPAADSPSGPPPPSQPPPPEPPRFGAAPPGPGPERSARRLYRSRTERMVSGVAGGIGEYLGVDPVLLRVMFAVLTVFGGLGALLYLVCWLMMPDEGERFSPVDTVLGRGPRRRMGLTGETVLLVSVAAVLTLFLTSHDGADYVLFAILLVIGLLVYRHLESQGPPPGSDGTAPPPDTPGTQNAAGTTGGASTGAQSTSDTAGFATWSTTHPWPGGSPGDPPGDRPGRGPVQAAGHTDATTSRSGLGLIGLCLALILAGVLVALPRGAGIHLSGRFFLALLLALVGVVLIIGTWWGHARSLILLGIPLALVLTLADDPPVYWGARDQTSAPSGVGEVAGTYRLDAAGGVLDLRAVDLPETSRDVSARTGAGELRTELPPDVDVRAHGVVTVGSMTLPGSDADGVRQTHTVLDHGAYGPGGGRLQILAAVDRLEVVR